jgi:hypothetical protein
MDRVDEYRRYATECRRLGEVVKNDENRVIPSDMAVSWEMLAEELELTKHVGQLRDSDQ